MTLFFLFAAVIVIVAAVRNTQGQLFDALREDIPAYTVWAAALIAIGVIGFIPGAKGISKVLLALVVIVLLVNNYTKILVGFQNAWQSPPPAQKAPPATSGNGGGSGGGLSNVLGDAAKSAAEQAALAAIGA